MATSSKTDKQSAPAPTATRGGGARATIVRGAVGALAGGAAIGAATRATRGRERRRVVLGIPIPRELRPRDFDAMKLAKSIDVKDLARQIGNAAEQIEARSEDVRLLSAQAKRLSRKLT